MPVASAGCGRFDEPCASAIQLHNLALAGAIAALEDAEFLAQSFELNQAGMQQINAGLDALGLKYLPSHANFATYAG